MYLKSFSGISASEGPWLDRLLVITPSQRVDSMATGRGQILSIMGLAEWTDTLLDVEKTPSAYAENRLLA